MPAVCEAAMLPDDPSVVRAVRFQLDELRPHIIKVGSENNRPTVWMTPTGFYMLYEYSASYPTGVLDGKVWKREIDNDDWMMMEYVDHGYLHRGVEVVGRWINIVNRR